MEGIKPTTLTIRTYSGEHIDTINMGPAFIVRDKADISDKAIYIMSPLSRSALESMLKPEILNSEHNGFKELTGYKQGGPASTVVLENLSLLIEQITQTFQNDGYVFGKVTVKSMMDYFPLIHYAYNEIQAVKDSMKLPYELPLTDENIQTLELLHTMYTTHLGYQLMRNDSIYVYIPDVIDINVQSVGPPYEHLYQSAIHYLYRWVEDEFNNRNVSKIHMMSIETAFDLFNESRNTAEYLCKFIDVCAKVHSDPKFVSTYQTSF